MILVLTQVTASKVVMQWFSNCQSLCIYLLTGFLIFFKEELPPSPLSFKYHCGLLDFFYIQCAILCFWYYSYLLANGILCPLQMAPSVFEYFHHFWHKIFQAHLYFPCFKPGISCFPKEPRFPLVETGIQKPRSGCQIYLENKLFNALPVILIVLPIKGAFTFNFKCSSFGPSFGPVWEAGHFKNDKNEVQRAFSLPRILRQVRAGATSQTFSCKLIFFFIFLICHSTQSPKKCVLIPMMLCCWPLLTASSTKEGELPLCVLSDK